METPPSRPWLGRGRLILAAVSIVGLAALWRFGPTEAEFLTRQAELQDLVGRHFFAALLLFFAAHTLLLALSAPVGATMNVLGGFFFGRWWGCAVISLATGLGALLALLILRHLAREPFRRFVARRPRLAGFVARAEAGVEHNGAAHLAALRLTPVLPYFIMNALFALTPMRAWTFWWVTQLTVIPVMFCYASAGASLAEVRSLGDLVSVELIVSLCAIALFPWAVVGLRKIYRRPRSPLAE